MNNTIDARSERFIADLDRINDRQTRIQRQISSGYRISQPSDAPEDVIEILQLRSDISRAQGVGRNLDRVTAEVNKAEAAIRVAEHLMERAKTLAAQTATTTATNRPAIALEIRQIHEQLVSITKTVSEGRFIFSGDSDQTPLYSSDNSASWSVPGGMVREAITTNTRQIDDVNGTRFSVGRSASQLFDTRNPDDTFASDNIFNAVYELGKAMEADAPAAIEGAAVLIESSLEHLGRELAFYGHTQNRIANAQKLTSDALVARGTELAGVQETDIAKALVELSTVKVHHEVALGAHAQQPRSTLFDYLA